MGSRPDGAMVDLHCRLPELDGDPDALWGRLATSPTRQVIAGVGLRVPGRDTAITCGPTRRAPTRTCWMESRWRILTSTRPSRGGRVVHNTLKLARDHHGIPAFAAGLRLLPEGRDLAHRLDVGDVRSLQHEIRREEQRNRRGAYALLTADVGIRQKFLSRETSFRCPYSAPLSLRCHVWPGADGWGWLFHTSGAQSGYRPSTKGDHRIRRPRAARRTADMGGHGDADNLAEQEISQVTHRA